MLIDRRNITLLTHQICIKTYRAARAVILVEAEEAWLEGMPAQAKEAILGILTLAVHLDKGLSIKAYNRIIMVRL